MYSARSVPMLGRYIIAEQIGASTMRNNRLERTGMLSVLKSAAAGRVQE